MPKSKGGRPNALGDFGVLAKYDDSSLINQAQQRIDMIAAWQAIYIDVGRKAKRRAGYSGMLLTSRFERFDNLSLDAAAISDFMSVLPCPITYRR
jgi:hypothetical protein